ncbi:SDR family oxidoreductase [Crateriforma conspicua]|uniref:SDR family oxidoreductase n=1 Tax=Crateriforma conspicua TaxID=2527996 RepID=UPI0011B42342|nr:SDR family oxidoreductase [Crateriforma conspicua]
MIDLSGKTALVTGGSRGIGRACALRLADCGANVAVNFLSSRDAATDVAKQINQRGVGSIAVRADVSRQDDCHALVSAVAEHFGGLDIVISNAAAGGFRGVAQLTAPNLEAAIRTNAAPVAWLCQAAAEHLADENDFGKVIAISSHGSIRAVDHYAAIGASKAALESLVRHMALEYGPQGINFNCVMPGIVRTEAVSTMPGVEDVLAAAKERLLVSKRDLSPDDVSGVVAFLASRQADMIQGQTIIVDGGITVRV